MQSMLCINQVDSVFCYQEKGLSLFEDSQQDSSITECDGDNPSSPGNDSNGTSASSGGEWFDKDLHIETGKILEIFQS